MSKRFGALTVTDAVSLAVPAGELHAVIGPNGAGKTTLMHQVSGLVPSDAGRVLLGERDVTGLAMPERVRAGLARSFQITSVLPDFSARANVALAVQARSGTSFRFWGRADDEADLNREADRLLAEVGLDGRGHVAAGHLSHGENRALELAIALATDPAVLLLDEPLAGTGHEEGRALIRLIASLKGRLTILLIEHDMDAVFALADRVSVLVYGRVVATDTPEAIRADPEVRAAYLGDETV
ncbi:ABC transporter ATP-binding protein [Marinivivus vitaminiproducens]|uniref:ABC transporter ATP-binding protein n=1 Tax=Marinivivus vitaminiproducens TaxID=3035935 RepID=UPI003FA0E624